MGNSFGNIFKITSWGESHGPTVGVVIEGCPAGIALNETDIQVELDRRRPGQSEIVSPRGEKDQVKILSGTYNNITLGTPIAMVVENKDVRRQDYTQKANQYRPSHADYTTEMKYGFRDPSGGGRASARETISRVMAGALAQKILNEASNLEIRAWVEQIENIRCPNLEFPKQEAIERSLVRCPDPETSDAMISLIESVRDAGDSVGGIIKCCIRNVPIGLGEPVFDKLEADLAKAMLSIPATKGFEIGSGFSSTTMRGSEHNDLFEIKDSCIRTKTNRSGGIQGGISNGEDIYFRIAFKPVSTIGKTQQTVDRHGNPTTIDGKGRHDPCVLPRAVPIVEAMASLVLVDHWMRDRAVHSQISTEESYCQTCS